MFSPRLHAMVERRERAGPLRLLLLAIEATSILILTHDYLTLNELQQDLNPRLPISEVEASALRNDMASLWSESRAALKRRLRDAANLTRSAVVPDPPSPLLPTNPPAEAVRRIFPAEALLKLRRGRPPAASAVDPDLSSKNPLVTYLWESSWRPVPRVPRGRNIRSCPLRTVSNPMPFAWTTGARCRSNRSQAPFLC